MGGLCDEGHEFLRVCRKRNPERTRHLIDVLVTQHSKWVAGRLRRSLFGQSSASKILVASADHDRQTELTQKPKYSGIRAVHAAQKPQKSCGNMRRLKAAFSNSETTNKVDQDVGQNGETFLLSP